MEVDSPIGRYWRPAGWPHRRQFGRFQQSEDPGPKTKEHVGLGNLQSTSTASSSPISILLSPHYLKASLKALVSFVLCPFCRRCLLRRQFFYKLADIRGVLMRLPGKLASAEMISLAVGDRCGGMRVRCKVVEFGDSIMRALWHDVLLADRFLTESRPASCENLRTS